VYGIRAPKEQRDQQFREIVDSDEWIVEGVYTSWVDLSLSAANKIIVLMPPLSVQETRIRKRYDERISGVVASKKRETPEGLKNLLEWNREYNLKKLPQFVENCQYREKVITLSDNLDVLDLFSK